MLNYQAWRKNTVPGTTQFRTAFCSPLVTVSNAMCNPPGTACTHEICYDKHRMAFLRWGHYRKHVGSDPIVADAASVIFFPRGEVFKTSHATLEGDWCTFVDFNDDALGESAVQCKMEAPFRCTHALIEYDTILSSRRLFKAIEGQVASPLAIEEGVLYLLNGVRSAEERRPVTARNTGAARRLAYAARDVVTTRACEAIGLQHVAQEVNSSPFHLARTFRAVHGTPMHQYQTRLRLAAALEKMLDGASDISGVALECGFNNHSHLTYAFRRAFGFPPSAVRSARN